jgi:uncharacterized phage-associated protein
MVTAMTEKLDVEKAIQAVGVLLRREGKNASRLRLLKLLYIADRMCIQKTGVPILGSKIVAMRHGPLHSEVLDLVNGQHTEEPSWSRHFRNVGRNVALQREPGVGRLARQEIELLNQVADERVGHDDWDVAVETHTYQEWRDAYPDREANTSQPISWAKLIDAVGRTADKDAILQDMEDSNAFDRFFAGVVR